MFLGLGYWFSAWWWSWPWASSAGPTYFISYTDPHSMQRDLGSSRVRVIQRTLCESAGKPVQPTYCSLPAELTVMGSSIVPAFHQHHITPLVAQTRASSFFLIFPGAASRTETAGVQWPHVEDIDTLHLSENFETLKTGRLLGIGRNGTGLRTRGQKVLLGLDFYRSDLVSN